jgi:Protein of unknown function (DUF1549)/Protein of unknown function (DUF1553)
MRTWVALAGRVLVIVGLSRAASALAEGESLHSLIDQHLAPVAGLEPGHCSDAEFLRRASLDLIGMPPTADEARAFIADKLSDKRVRLVDRLFASPQFARHLTAVLDVMLMERRPHTHVSADEWQAWLLKGVRENKPWNLVAREVLSADGDSPAERPPARFALDRGSDPHAVTRDIGRVFFGCDMQCAQCHDHPLVNDYLQSDYHGLLAFVSPSFALVRNDGGAQKTLQAEKAGADLMFESVFEGIPRRTGARMPESVMIDEPFYLPGDEYQVLPADNVKSVPKFSRRAKLAELATNGSNEAFNQNIVNRLWAMMFGRGLVHPLDMHHPDNPPTHPELLRLLADRFAAMNFDMRGFLRELALTSAYQRSFDLPEGWLAASARAAADAAELKKRRSALDDAAQESAEAYEAAIDAWKETEASLLPLAGELDAARTQYADAKKKFDEALAALASAKAQLQAKQSVARPVERAATAMSQAAEALPEDAQLAEATAKLVARRGELAAELAALSKAFEEKTTAIGPATTALGTVMPNVGATLAKTMPLSAAMIRAEQEMLAARGRAAEEAESLAALDRRVETSRCFAKVAEVHHALLAANEKIPLRAAELAAAQKEAAVKKATEELAASADLAAAGAQGTIRFDVAGAAGFVSATATQPMLAEATQKSAGDALAAAHQSLAAASAERDRRAKVLEEAKAALAAVEAQAAAKQSAFKSAQLEMTDRWSSDFTIAALKPLTPEQLCWTVFRVTGVYDRQWQAEAAELEKASPLTEEQKKDPAQAAARQIAIEQRTFDKLKGNMATFVAFYGAAAGQPQGDFFATADQALFAANGGSINGWIAAAGDNVTERVAKQDDSRAAAEELYLTALTRRPTDQEISRVVDYLSSRGQDKGAAAQELVWSLLNSAEFRFNH